MLTLSKFKTLCVHFILVFFLIKNVTSAELTTLTTTTTTSPKKYSNIIFDIGGVLVDWEPFEIAHDIFKDSQNLTTQEIELTIQSMIHSQTWQEFDRGTYSRKELITIFSKTYNENIVRPFILKIPSYLKQKNDGLLLFKAIKKQGYKRYILSNAPKENIDDVLQFHEYYNDNDGMIFSCNVAQIKPEPQIYQTLLQTYSLKAEDCLFLDDSEKNITAAKQAGIDGILYDNAQYVAEKLTILGIL